MNSRSAAHTSSALLLALALSACGGGSAPPAPQAFDGDVSTVLTITVENQQLEEARVWLWVDGQRERLGSVRANQRVTFHHPMDGIRSVHMEFAITLGPTCVTADVSLGPGDTVGAVIPSILQGFQGICT